MELENLRNIRLDNLATHRGTHCTEMRFASFLFAGFITAIVVNPPERKLAKHTYVHCSVCHFLLCFVYAARDLHLAMKP